MLNNKIGIATWYRNGNYGGTLQAVALAYILKNMGYHVEFIRYRPNLSIKYKIERFFKNIMFSILYPKSSVSRNKIWNFVDEEMPQSPTFTKNSESLCLYAQKNYIAAICGSDQIWSSINGVDDFYFLTFVEKNKRIAYAPSIGVENINYKYREKFRRCVEDIPFLSVREEKGQSIIYELTGKKSQLVLDPTLLLTGDEWRIFAEKITPSTSLLPARKYILCYYIGEYNKYCKFTDSLAAKLQLPVYYISSKRYNMGKSQVVGGVREFVQLIDKASYVLTDSFHGLCFSIIMQKHVGVFWRFSENDPKSQNSRVANLINLLNLNKLIVDSNTVLETFLSTPPDYSSSNSILDMYRKKSKDYLYNALQKTIDHAI